MKKTKPEIMAPAGDWISLRAAIDAGCDSVYFGIKGINMRAGAKNFAIPELKKITQTCHKNDVKAYLALNTVVYEKEIKNIAKILAKAKAAGIDAVICWDMAVIREANKQKIPVFISTQMSVSNSQSIIFFYETLGIKRFVLARECSIEDIKRIRKELKKALGVKAKEIGIEVFVHGAMCVSISGRCFLSQFQFGKSANRGECIQPCRREYKITDIEEKHSFVIGNNYLLSPKDLCVLPFIEKLIEAGVDSLKIEGRNRSPEYVRTVTSAYRKAIDFYFENKSKNGFEKEFDVLKKKLVDEVKRVYHRGFSSGFFMGKPINEWTDSYGSKATTRKEYVGVVKNYYKKHGVAEIKVESNEFNKGDEIMFQGPTTGVFSQKADSIEINHKQVNQAVKGEYVAVKTKKLVRVNDKIYKQIISF
ncbi:MAG: peptidase U32 family protein [Nanoarchaeota archaeon]|nr:peptidase U32 family protein [Nanoarchaeota archaeon]